MNTIKFVTWSSSSFGALLIADWWAGLFLLSLYVHLECAIEYSVQGRCQLCSITVACLIEQFYYESTLHLDTFKRSLINKVIGP